VRKRKTEAEAILGPIVETGRTRGVPTPLTARIIATIGEIEAGRLALATENLLALGREPGLAA
jgi:2-dehydropantoate 2-reductase